MKRTVLIVALLVSAFAIANAQQKPADNAHAAPPAPASQTVPEAIAVKIGQVDQRTAALQHDLQLYNLLRENLVLSAALELGLTKKDLDAMELARDGKGQLVFRKVETPASSPPAPAPAKPK